MTKSRRSGSSKKNTQTSLLSVIVTGIVALVLFILSSVFGIDLSGLLGGGSQATARPTTPTIIANATRTPQPTPRRTMSPVSPSISPTPFQINYPRMPPRSRLEQTRVVRVVDGDTVVVDNNGRDLTLRLIGLNTPETVAPRQPVECFGREASNRAKELLPVGKTVYLEIDDTQDTIDRYGRALRYLWYDDGKLFNMQMIAEGYAYEYTYDRAYKYQTLFRQAQQEAKAANRGLWSPDTCNGQR